jgi:two-component system, LytTR family, response regulator
MRVLIVDDEPPARAKLRRLLSSKAEVEIVGEAASGREAVEQIATLEPDLVFLDVQMPELNGFEVIDAIGVEQMPRVVFVTAFDDYALRAFEVQALDYLLKPFTPERFDAVLARAIADVENTANHALASKLEQLVASALPAKRHLHRLLVHQENRAFFLAVDRVDRFAADRNYIRVHSDGAVYTIRGTLAVIAERLDPQKFLRINRSEIVRLDAIKELQPWFHGDYRVVMRDGSTLMWSRRYRARDEGGASDFEIE